MVRVGTLRFFVFLNGNRRIAFSDFNNPWLAVKLIEHFNRAVSQPFVECRESIL